MGGAVSEGHLLTIEEVADALRVSVRTVWRMVRDKQIPVTWVRWTRMATSESPTA